MSEIVVPVGRYERAVVKAANWCRCGSCDSKPGVLLTPSVRSGLLLTLSEARALASALQEIAAQEAGHANTEVGRE